MLPERSREGSPVDEIDVQKLPEISLAEVKKHKTADDCWMVIHGGVYDLKGFLDKHPGGSQILLKYAGMDATLAFDDVGHSMESLKYDMPVGSLKGFCSQGAEPVDEKGDDQDEDTDCITMAHDRSLDFQKILNKFYTWLLYSTIVICVSLLLYMRLRCHFKMGPHDTMVHKVRHHVDDTIASPDTRPRTSDEEFGIPAWAY